MTQITIHYNNTLIPLDYSAISHFIRAAKKITKIVISPVRYASFSNRYIIITSRVPVALRIISNKSIQINETKYEVVVDSIGHLLPSVCSQFSKFTLLAISRNHYISVLTSLFYNQIRFYLQKFYLVRFGSANFIRLTANPTK